MEGKQEPQRCGAKRRRDGQPCQKWPVSGQSRCRLHGAGGGPRNPRKLKGNGNALAHGVYARRSLLPGEAELIPLIKERLESLDDEILMLKLLFRRCVLAEAAWERQQTDIERTLEAGEDLPPRHRKLFGVEQVEEEDSPAGPRRKVLRRARNFSDEIIKYGRAIVQAVRARAELGKLAAEPDVVGQFVHDLRDFAQAAIGTLPGPVEGNGDRAAPRRFDPDHADVEVNDD